MKRAALVRDLQKHKLTKSGCSKFVIPYLSKTLRDTVEAQEIWCCFTHYHCRERIHVRICPNFFLLFYSRKSILHFLTFFFKLPDYAFNPCRLLAVKLLKNGISIFLTRPPFVRRWMFWYAICTRTLIWPSTFLSHCHDVLLPFLSIPPWVKC